MILIGQNVHWRLSRYEEVEDCNKDPSVRPGTSFSYLNLVPRG